MSQMLNIFLNVWKEPIQESTVCKCNFKDYGDSE